MHLSLRQAAIEARVAKSTIQRAISTGRLSAGRTDDGGYAIDPAELFRVYPPEARPAARPAGQDAPAADPVADALVVELRAQLARMERALDDLRADRDDLRQDRDEWRDQAKRLALAAPVPAPPAETSAPVDPASRLARAWWWMRKAG